jgi:cytochrome c
LGNFKKQIMKTVILVAALSFCLWSCNNKKEEQNFGKPTEPVAVEAKSAEFPLAEKGAALFEGKGTCATCHKTDVKLVGPSLQDIAKNYKEKKASIAAFLNGELDPIVDPTQFEVMKANFVVTKAMTDEDRQALEQYIYSQGL